MRTPAADPHEMTRNPFESLCQLVRMTLKKQWSGTRHLGRSGSSSTTHKLLKISFIGLNHYKRVKKVLAVQEAMRPGAVD